MFNGLCGRIGIKLTHLIMVIDTYKGVGMAWAGVLETTCPIEIRRRAFEYANLPLWGGMCGSFLVPETICTVQFQCHLQIYGKHVVVALCWGCPCL